MKVRWSDDEIKFIKENYLTMNSVILSQHLNRSALSVKGKMRQLGLSLPKDVADLFVSQAASDMIKKRNLVGNKNPNWKGGISENNYHYKKLQVERYPERVNARKLVHNAIKDGKLVRGCIRGRITTYYCMIKEKLPIVAAKYTCKKAKAKQNLI